MHQLTYEWKNPGRKPTAKGVTPRKPIGNHGAHGSGTWLRHPHCDTKWPRETHTLFVRGCPETNV